MTIKAKWMGQDCTVENSRTWEGTLIFLVAALPGQAFPDGSTMFSAYRPELTDIAVEDTRKAEALENLVSAISDTDTLVDQDARYAVAAALSIENMARAAFAATLE
ncbi:MAG: hypothetical protein WC710_14165 [Gallionella sp.]|jgi:hypothetical protein